MSKNKVKKQIDFMETAIPEKNQSQEWKNKIQKLKRKKDGQK